MYILNVIPITKIPLPHPQVLSYFYSQKLNALSLVKIPLGKRSAPGLVKFCEPLGRQRLHIRKAGFQLKRVLAIIALEPIMSAYQLRLAEWLSEYYYSPLGLMLKTILPSEILTPSHAPLFVFPPIHRKWINREQRTYLVWANQPWSIYETAIRKCMEKKRQVLFLIPEIDRLDEYKKRLEKISSNIILLHGSLKRSEYLKTWKKLMKADKGIILGSRSAVFAPFRNLGLVIVDEEENPHYKSWDMHPRYHARDVALKLAELTGAKTVLGSSFPSVGSYYNATTQKYKLNDLIPKPYTLNPRIIDMREELKEGNSSIFSAHLQKSLRETLHRNEQVILFMNRRGLATVLLCRECGYIFTCGACDSPMVFHERQESKGGLSPLGGTVPPRVVDENDVINHVVICHHCGHEQPAPNVCPKCGGWKIKLFGAGTQKVVEELSKLFPDIPFLRVDSDSIKTRKKTQDLFFEFRQKKFLVAIGTQLLLKQNLPKVPLFAIVSMETILTLPDVRTSERSYQLINFGYEHAEREFLIQTYRPDHYVFHTIADPQLFYREELEMRKIFQLPPYTQFIKLSFSHTDGEQAQQEAHALKRKITDRSHNLEKTGTAEKKPFEVFGPIPAFIPKTKGRYTYHLLIKSQLDNLKVRNQILDVVPPRWVIDVDPESIL